MRTATSVSLLLRSSPAAAGACWGERTGCHVGLWHRCSNDWAAAGERAPDAYRFSLPLCQIVPACYEPVGVIPARGRSHPAGNALGVVHDGGGRKSHQLPSNGYRLASKMEITRAASARTAASSSTQ